MNTLGHLSLGRRSHTSKVTTKNCLRFLRLAWGRLQIGGCHRLVIGSAGSSLTVAMPSEFALCEVFLTIYGSSSTCLPDDYLSCPGSSHASSACACYAPPLTSCPPRSFGCLSSRRDHSACSLRLGRAPAAVSAEPELPAEPRRDDCWPGLCSPILLPRLLSLDFACS